MLVTVNHCLIFDMIFLSVSLGANIDRAHHATNAYKALSETVTLSDAVQKAADMTRPEDTLTVVTADHSHVFTIGGYPSWDNPIMGRYIIYWSYQYCYSNPYH